MAATNEVILATRPTGGPFKMRSPAESAARGSFLAELSNGTVKRAWYYPLKRDVDVLRTKSGIARIHYDGCVIKASPLDLYQIP